MSTFSSVDTVYVNLFGGPGCGKSTMAALLFAELKMAGQTCELVFEYAKELVWAGDLERLKDQAHIARSQYAALKLRQGKTRFVVTDGPLANSLYYLHAYPHVSDTEKTEAEVLAWLQEFPSLNLFLRRGDFRYEQEGRYQDEATARGMDADIWDRLNTHLVFETVEPFSCAKQLARRIIESADRAYPPQPRKAA